MLKKRFLLLFVFMVFYLLNPVNNLSFAKDELRENSWRYKDGVPIEIPNKNGANTTAKAAIEAQHVLRLISGYNLSFSMKN